MSPSHLVPVSFSLPNDLPQLASAPARFAQDPTTSSAAPADAPAQGGDANTNSQVGQPVGGAGQQPAPCAGDSMMYMLPAFALMIYFLMIRPDQKRRKEQQQLLASIKVGARVVTLSGLHGEVASLTDDTVTLRVDSVQMTFDRSAVARILSDDAAKAGA